MDRKKLYDLGRFLTEKLYGWERKVFLMTDSNRELQSAKDEYLAQQMTPEQVRRFRGKIDRAKKEKRRKLTLVRIRNLSTMAAALVAAFVILPNTTMGVANAMENVPFLGKLVSVVTFRDYHYEDEKNSINVEVPELVVEPYMLTAPEEGAEIAGETADTTTAEMADAGIAEETTDATTAGTAEEAADTASVEMAQKLSSTTSQINMEIQSITDELIAEFEKNKETGYQNITVKSQTLSTTADYFALKLICYQGMGSGAEWDYFYTIDLTTGERLALADLFPENEDYITRISEDIKKQMREQMDADDNVYYWLEDEVTEWNFQSITEETSFYLDQDGRLVICFNEGDVAPMYMGCVEFRISEDIYSRY